MENYNEFQRLVEIVRALRNPVGGCPWDLEQTHRTLRPYLVEETYEVLEAIDQGEDLPLKEELGDLMLQVVLHSQLASERNSFSIEDVSKAVADKMVRRHPHVFGDTSATTSREVLTNWELIKSKEKSTEGKKSVLSGVPAALPSLVRAQRIGEKASRVGFDWSKSDDVWACMLSELKEFQEVFSELTDTSDKPLSSKPAARTETLQARLEEELGDLLFSICQFARWIGVSAEDSLRGAVNKFAKRFETMEANAGSNLSQLGAEELERLWQLAKLQSK